MPLITLENFRLECGETISELTLSYQTFGKLNANKDNVIWVCHALTANTDMIDWWDGLFGSNHLFDPSEYFIVCVNAPGSCYGSTGPATPIANKRPLLDKFPLITTRDAQRSFEAVRKALKIEKVYLLIGGSVGGQHALEWSIEQPEVFENVALIATNAQHSPYGIAFNESQRLSIQADATYGNGKINGGQNGLKAARSIALLSYRSPTIYRQTQEDENKDNLDNFRASGYQQYQGEKLVRRFNAYSYVCLTKMMDSHNVGRGRRSISEALKLVKAKTLVVGIGSDQLFPPSEQKYLAHHIPGAEYAEISSSYGHDGFLVETQKLSVILEDFLFNNFKNHKPTVFRSTVRKHELIQRLG
ncbi:MAG: homoserine O-acetyltransferase [Fluviicola sp. XM-24bin1]|nr:MAG: homoserine O-acetyltransferase [Fluviicola sp. XM-24bin1]